MDNPGWKATKKAAHDHALYSNPHRQANGHFNAVEHVDPVNEAFIEYKARGPTISESHPNTDGIETRTRTDSVASSSTHLDSDVKSSASSSTISSAIERSKRQRRKAPPRMNPHLQVMCGPLLRYDTVDSNGNYRAALLIVTADAGSVYEPHPNVIFEWDPELRYFPRQSEFHERIVSETIGPKNIAFIDGLPPVLSRMPSSIPEHQPDASSFQSARAQKEVVPGEEIWVYDSGEATFTFWRFLIEIPLTETEMCIRYRVNLGPVIGFFVPARNQNMRCAAYSCNGFSAGVNPDEFRGPGFSSGYDPLWIDLLQKHAERPFHVLVGGGDQLYCDSLVREPELQEWINLKNPSLKRAYQLTEEIEAAIDRFYFSHYCLVFRTGAFARANCTIPMLNMLDDHDLIDGFGSYPDDLQESPMFSRIGSRGYFFYLLFQCFTVADVDGMETQQSAHTFRSTIIGGKGPWIPFRSHSILSYMGPKVWMLLLDCRAERKKNQVCGPTEYSRVLDMLYRLPPDVEHLVVQLGIPIAYPRMNFLEAALGSKLNPLLALGRTGSLGFSSFVNKFNAEAELLDDLNDHWTSKGHKQERNWFIERLQEFALTKHVRVSFLSGDVHCAAVGLFKTLGKGTDPEHDYRYMINVVSSAIVNTPPPVGVLSVVGLLADKRHKSMHYAATDETMIPLFEKDTNGAPIKSKFAMGRRNWCSLQLDESSGDLEFEIRVEREKGVGQTIGYPVRAPRPLWSSF